MKYAVGSTEENLQIIQSPIRRTTPEEEQPRTTVPTGMGTLCKVALDPVTKQLMDPRRPDPTSIATVRLTDLLHILLSHLI